MPTPPAKQTDFLRAVAEAGPSDITRLYWYARVTLLADIAGLAAFDRVFEAWFLHGDDTSSPLAPPVDDSDVRLPRAAGERELPLTESGPGNGVEASAAVSTHRRQFDHADKRQRDLLRSLRAAWPANLPTVASRRRRPARSGRGLDLRRTLRHAHRTDGEIVELRFTVRPRRPRRLLVLLDVSGSVKEHTPDLLRLAHCTPARTEVFTFGTRLTRITGALSVARVERALEAVSDRVRDVDGGTAIGAAMQQFLHNPRFLGLARGALIVVISDGLERGDCTAMLRATERFSRLGYRLLWWSPLACAPTYRPVTRGLAGVLRHLDHLGGVRDLRTGLTEVGRIPSVTTGARRAAAHRWHTKGAVI